MWHSGGEEDAGGELEWKTTKHPGQFESLDSPTLETCHCSMSSPIISISELFYFTFTAFNFWLLICFPHGVKSRDKDIVVDFYIISSTQIVIQLMMAKIRRVKK